jgi:hypothetical protein
MRRFPGHLRAAEPLREEALHLLLAEYDRYQPFVDDCARLKASGMAAALNDPPIGAIDSYLRARAAVETFAKRWNLDRIPETRQFEYHAVRAAVDQVGRKFGHLVGTPFRPASIVIGKWEPDYPSVAYDGQSWSWHLGRVETLADFRNRIAEDLDVVPVSMPPEITRQLWTLPDEASRLGWSLTDVPHKLAIHVRWLFLRLCPQPDRPLGPGKIAARETEIVDERTVRRAINHLARTLAISLPPLKVGRPRRSRTAA